MLKFLVSLQAAESFGFFTTALRAAVPNIRLEWFLFLLEFTLRCPAATVSFHKYDKKRGIQI
jgi:hypothetical protein